MRICRVILCAMALFLGGCVVIPESEDEPYPSSRVNRIQIGASTKSTVTSEFGPPRHTTRDGRIIAYHADQLHATAYLLVGGPYAGYILPIPIWTGHNLVIHFSADDVVESVKQMPGSLLGYCFSESQCFSAESNPVAMRKQAQMISNAKERKRDSLRAELLPKAGAGDTSAQYELASYYYLNLEERWYWICHAAHGGHPEARFMMAADNLTSAGTDIATNHQAALLWFLLAADAGSVQAVDAAHELSATMPEEEIAEAQNQLSEWRPNLASCSTAETDT